jgi:osmotically-inducible protein OsmY
MGFRDWIGALAIAGIALAPSAALAQTASANTDDAALKTRVETRLKSSAPLKQDDIDVSVDHGVVTLKGTVHSKAQSERAARLAKVAGVTKVDNQLEVDNKAAEKAEEKSEKATGTAGAKMDRAVDKTASGAKTVGSKTKDGAKEVGEAITDAWITTKIKTDFVNEDALKGSDINVDTNDHVVTLKGTVASEAGRARAVQVAKTTKGVSRVVDTLSIAPPK